MRIGLIGFGSMGKTHAYAVNNLGYFYSDGISAEISGVCTAHKETSEKAAHDFGFKTAVTDEDELIGSPDIDIIDICTPNICHYNTRGRLSWQGSISTVKSLLRSHPRRQMSLLYLQPSGGSRLRSYLITALCRE